MPFVESAERRREITVQELGALLSGIDLNQAKRRKRYQRSALVLRFCPFFARQASTFKRNVA